MRRDGVLVVIMFWPSLFNGWLLYMEMYVPFVILLALSTIALVKVADMDDDF